MSAQGLCGSDASVSMKILFVLRTMINPEVQKQGQAEIDSVIGHDRFPQLADRDQLPYVSVLYLEVLPILLHPLVFRIA
ncbi:hypothetical protein SCP_0903240 [Sparassis crispa]|uniref:Cytochrome P450 n=1 Tax=Sparassis crispa TaxID=139825 RepID=A0A401GW51_9APHY|nr:hypothetical protein SCP_0903240 [Sparassis crispa]GBE86445.1 hypothetical protein SCP_0903240 [Sparassis crispa]